MPVWVKLKRLGCCARQISSSWCCCKTSCKPSLKPPTLLPATLEEQSSPLSTQLKSPPMSTRLQTTGRAGSSTEAEEVLLERIV